MLEGLGLASNVRLLILLDFIGHPPGLLELLDCHVLVVSRWIQIGCRRNRHFLQFPLPLVVRSRRNLCLVLLDLGMPRWENSLRLILKVRHLAPCGCSRSTRVTPSYQYCLAATLLLVMLERALFLVVSRICSGAMAATHYLLWLSEIDGSVRNFVLLVARRLYSCRSLNKVFLLCDEGDFRLD